MTDPVKPVRRYDASRRQEQARENRRRILAAASELLREKGYADTAMPDVAKLAGVSVQTVYKAFSNKATLLKAVFDVSVAGDDEPVPVAGREFIAAIQAEPDAARKIRMYLDHFASNMPRVAPLQLLTRDAAAADHAAAEVWAQMRREMLTAMTYFSADLMATGQVRPELSAEDVRDVLWTYHSPEQYELLVLERGWSPKRYGEFLERAIIAAVLG
jgi:AcrR family transcriptional regulator